jgi:hypothetical protein
MTLLSGSSDFRSPQEFAAAIDAERARESEPIVIDSPGECPWRRVKGRNCDECRRQGGLLAYWSVSPLERRRYDVRGCLRVVGEQLREVRIEELKELIRTAGLTDEEGRHTLTRAAIDEHNRAAYEYLGKWRPGSGGIYLTAKRDGMNPTGNGVGKSYALHALCVRLACEGVSSLYRTTAAFLTALRESFDLESFRDSEADIIKAYVDAPVLLLDNIGGENIGRDSDWAANRLFQVIDERIRRGNPIVAAGRFGLDYLAGHFGEKHGPDIASRLAGHCTVFALGGGDRRLAKAGGQ